MKSQAKKGVYPEQGRRVFVGLSGGVDSAVSAALLKQQGFDVTGVFIKAWNPPGFVCTWKEDRRSAMRAAAVLDIPFITLDLEKEYKKEVVDYMIKEYKEGRTPNPDVMCNKEIKFGHFLKFALESGADFVATGHYAKNELWSMNYELCEAKDENKDQTYFLWTLTQGQLKHILFPIGHLQKEEVRKLAEKFNLPQATRKDSQGLCFLGKIDMKEFLKDYLKPNKGKVLDAESGEVVGEHDGAMLYTLGERHGFRIFNEKTNSKPLYVVAKNIKKNTITVSPTISATKTASQKVLGSLRSTRLFSKQFSSQNWISGEAPKGQIKCRIRYRGEKIKCEVVGEDLVFKEPQLIASGQSAVFYSSSDEVGQGEICLGGAIIA